MRTLSLVALLAVLALAPAAAQPPTFDQAYQARLALGDIPTTSTTEGTGWNLVQKVRVQHTAGNETVASLNLPAGMTAQPPTCTCGVGEVGSSGSSFSFTIPAATATGSYEVSLASSQAAADTGLALGIPVPAGHASDAVVIVYVPDGHELEAPGTAFFTGACTQDPCSIHAYEGTAAAPLASPFAVAVRPTTDAAAPPADSMTPWLYAAVAFVAGCIVWALLVRQGIVQRKTRRQSVATAQHEEIAATETVAVLEGRKRALMAALKEIEIAHQSKQMDTATYDAVKADFKRQTVTVMRALETGEARKDQS